MSESAKDRHEFKPLLVEIEEEPLNPLGRLIFWVIICALLFTSLWLYFGRVDVVVSARGKVIPAGEVKTVQPLTTGVVRKILVEAGQLVEAGDLLMEINPSDTEPELASMRDDLKQANLEIERLEALLGGKSFAPTAELYDADQLVIQQQRYRAAVESLAGQIRAKKNELNQVESELDGVRKSIEQNTYLLDVGRRRQARLEPVRDLISRDDFERAQTDVVDYENRLSADKYKLEELQAEKAKLQQQLGLIETENRQTLLEDLTKKRQEKLYLQAKIERTDFVNARQQIRSPVRGHVSQLLVHTVGGVVTPAEKLAVIVPVDSRPMIRTQVLNKDVGFVAPGMEVAVKIDTFEFQRYGMLRGKLVKVARDSVEDEHLGLVYDAWVEPLETSLNVDGVETPLSTGMTVTAEIKVGKRRLIEFFVYPLIKYLNEGTSVR